MSPRPRGRRADTVTAKASLNNMQPYVYWRSNLGDTAWSRVKDKTQFRGFYPELCSCACRAGARSPERTSTGTPPPRWYSPGCSSLLQHTRPHLDQRRQEGRETRDVGVDLPTGFKTQSLVGKYNTKTQKKNQVVWTFELLNCSRNLRFSWTPNSNQSCLSPNLNPVDVWSYF